MTYADIEARILADLNRTDLQPSIAGYVNDVYREMLNRRVWSWMTATTETNTTLNGYRYELPTDCGDILSIVVVDGITAESIPYIPPEDFDNKYPMVETDTTGTPEIYTIRHGFSPSLVEYNEINVYPRADKTSYVLRMYYTIKVVDLSGAVVPVIPAAYHSILVFGGLETAFARLREYDAAAFWMKKKEILYKVMDNADSVFPSQPQLRPFNPTQTYPASYWTKYTVRSVS